MIPYIFFDVDGVLNKESDWRTKRYSINDNCLNSFANIVYSFRKRYKESPRLVICSTWRAGAGDSSALSILDQRLSEVGLKIWGSTPVTTNKTRQEEIEFYIRRNGVESYIVIDDDDSLYDRKDEINLYVPDYRKGLMAKDEPQISKQFARFAKKK